MKKYDLILADPPWKYDNKQQHNPNRGGITYPYLTMQDIYDLPIHRCVKDDAILICWVTFPKLFDKHYEKIDPLDIIRNWGFRPLTALFFWIKTNKKAIIPDYELDETTLDSFSGYYSGMGKSTNSNAEIAIIARRGKSLERKDKAVKQLIVSPVGKHSAKPQEQYTRIERLYGNVDKIELFARKENPPSSNWDATGLDWDGIDIRDWIKRYE